ncbi:sulfurtransferase [Lutimaribacter marinistellae]|uniref:Sulfurtransferase n=1 Tax=Lutimaribacter marinistellae TaxID=1820329 RepID=A0ABV7TK85_9RHOB
MTDLRHPDALVDTAWLEAHLDDPKLRIFDCSTVLDFKTSDGRPYRVLNCKPEHDAGHIPGAGIFDLQAEFSDPDSPYGMTLSPPDKVAAAFARHGVDDETRVILYSRRSPSWATRFWWMLHWLGFDRAAVLDGGWEKWAAEKRPRSTTPCTYPQGHLTVRPRPGAFVGRDEVLAALPEPQTCLVNALGADIFHGRNARYGRPGRIPGSVNVPKVDLVDARTHAFLPPDQIAAAFAAVGADRADRHITYCGGGIFATVDAFWLYQLGHDKVAVYDNSMSEWGSDATLPIETG